MKEKTYIAIDLKSFYASVECVERGLDPLTAKLVVADISRTDKTICLAVTPALKAMGVSGRPRLFEVKQRIKVPFIIAPPQMAHYLRKSTEIYQIYLKYIAPEDIHVYSIDEVFIDATKYLFMYKMTARELTMRMIQDVLRATGITATAGIGTNLYLCKIAMDIVAKHLPADKEGVRIAELDEQSYRRLLWSHRPLKDFWRVGSGTVRRLEKIGLTCMGDIARYSTFQYGEDKLYKEFGVNAELLIDHAWGWEPCSLEAVKAYVPKENSLSSGQVLHCPYEFAQARIVLQEMVDALSLELVRKQLVTDQLVLTIGYDIENLAHGRGYDGEIVIDHYGRRVPKHARGSRNIGKHTSSTHLLVSNALELFDGIVDSRLWIRRITIAVNHVLPERFGKAVLPSEEQLTLFADYEAVERERKKALLERSKERSRQEAILSLQKKYGKNAILKGISLMQGATARQRNEQIGGHKA